MIGQHFQIESWAICRQTMDLLGGTCLVPDLIPIKNQKQVRGLNYSYDYEVLAIYKNINSLREVDLELLEKLKN